MKIALVYDRVNKWGGAERDLLALHEIFPDAPLYTSLYNPKGAPWAKVFPKVVPSFLNRIPFASDKHEHLAYLMPIAYESLDFSDFEVVISVTSEAAKGIITKPKSLHICYCLTPNRYLWSHYDTYFQDPILKVVSKPVVGYLRKWDKIAAQRPDIIIAQSKAVQKRIKRYYARESQIIYPPADVEFFSQGPSGRRENFFLIVSRLVPYKRVDLAVRAFNKLALPLYIIGSGSEEERLKSMAGKNIRFVKELTDSSLRSYYRKCVAFIMPQEEDFGLAAVEAQASGAPVIAYRAGGALDIVVEGKSGLFFDKQSPEALMGAVKKYRRLSFNAKWISRSSQRFSKKRFKQGFLKLLKESGRL
jgi:glycosyltransferase involved in cell wall biosynthesis